MHAENGRKMGGKIGTHQPSFPSCLRCYKYQRAVPRCMELGLLLLNTSIAFQPAGVLPAARIPSAKCSAPLWSFKVSMNTGAFLTTAIYCLFLHSRHKTLGELIELPVGQEKARLPVNFAMAAITGRFWYGQFFFYNLGHVRMGEYKFTSWAIHMIMLVLFSNVVGVALREWHQCRRATRTTISLAITGC